MFLPYSPKSFKCLRSTLTSSGQKNENLTLWGRTHFNCTLQVVASWYYIQQENWNDSSKRGGEKKEEKSNKFIKVKFLRRGLNPANAPHTIRANDRQPRPFLNWENPITRHMPFHSSLAAVHLSWGPSDWNSSAMGCSAGHIFWALLCSQIFCVFSCSSQTEKSLRIYRLCYFRDLS